jgi:DNA-directed RNA polymerase subunit RPC12/RpoP
VKSLTCTQCGGTFPLSTFLDVQGQIRCGECSRKELVRLQIEKTAPGTVRQLLDPTVCRKCGKDNGETALEKVAGLPACEDCAARFRHFPYPAWIKAGFAALVILAVSSLVWNWRFLAGHRLALAAQRAVTAGDLERGATLMGSAAREVPESGELAYAASFYQALHLLREARSGEALEVLKGLAKRTPGNPATERVLLHAQSLAAFEAKDYDKLLELSLLLLKREPESQTVLGQVSSAYACKYAVTGSEEFKREAIHYLELARKAAGPADPVFKEYEERILDRLSTRQILSKKEYDLQHRRPGGVPAGQVSGGA